MGTTMPPSPARNGSVSPAPHPQLAHVPLAPRLQPDDQEEQRHQPGVHELAQVNDHARAADQEGKRRRPELVVGGDADVRPDQGGHGGARQHRGAARLGPQERAQRRLHAPRPGRPPGKRPPRLLNASVASASQLASAAASGQPQQTQQPQTTIHSRTLTGAISCVAISIVIPPSASSLITSSTSATSSGSSALVTTSSSIAAAAWPAPGRSRPAAAARRTAGPGSLPAFHPYRTGRGACPSSWKLSWMIYDRRPGGRRRGWP